MTTFSGSINTKYVNDICIIELIGDFCFTNKHVIIEALKNADKNYTKIILDLSNTSHLDSTIIGTFINFIHDSNGVIIQSKNKGIQKVFDILGLSAFFKLVFSLEEALQQFENKTS